MSHILSIVTFLPLLGVIAILATRGERETVARNARAIAMIATVANLVVGARNEAQLTDNLGAVGWGLGQDQIARLDQVSRRPPVYPYWHQMDFDERDPKPTQW